MSEDTLCAIATEVWRQFERTQDGFLRKELPRLKEISHTTLLLYVTLFVAADRQEQDFEVSVEHDHRVRHEMAGAYQGYTTGYEEPAEAARRYEEGRKARKRIHASARGAHKAVEGIKGALENNYDALPPHIRARVSGAVVDMFALLKQLLIWTDINDHASPLKRQEAEADELRMTKNAQVLLWWWLYVPACDGRWEDMHAVAQALGVSYIKDIEDFKRYVRKVVSERTRANDSLMTRPAPSWARESGILPEIPSTSKL